MSTFSIDVFYVSGLRSQRTKLKKSKRDCIKLAEFLASPFSPNMPSSVCAESRPTVQYSAETPCRKRKSDSFADDVASMTHRKLADEVTALKREVDPLQQEVASLKRKLK